MRAVESSKSIGPPEKPATGPLPFSAAIDDRGGGWIPSFRRPKRLLLFLKLTGKE